MVPLDMVGEGLNIGYGVDTSFRDIEMLEIESAILEQSF